MKTITNTHSALKNTFTSLASIISVTLMCHATASAAIESGDDIDTSSLKAASVSSDANAQLEKIYDGVREFHIFKPMYARWSGTDTFTTLVTGQNGFPVFSPRSDKDPRYTDYPIDYENNTITRYRPVRPPESVLGFYTDKAIPLGDKETATYNAPMVAAGTLGKGRVLIMGSHLYDSILVDPRNYSDNIRRNNKTGTPDSEDMEQFFHNTFAWLTEQNEIETNRYTKTSTSINVLSNKSYAMFWGISSAGYNNDIEPFQIHSNFNVTDGANPKYVTTWKEASAEGLIDPSVYPLLILEDFERTNAWTGFAEHTVRKTQMDEVDLIANYIRAGGGVLIMDSPFFLEKYGVVETAANEILKLAGITTFFSNNSSNVQLLPRKDQVGGVHQYDICLSDYIGHTDLQRRLGMDDYSNIPETLSELKIVLTANGTLNYLEELLSRRERKIFLEGTEENQVLSLADCGTVEVDDADGNKINIQSVLVKGDGISQDGGNYDRFAKYPVDLNFVEAQGDVGGSMNTLLAHELKESQLTETDLNREYTNMSALLLNDAVFTGEKFATLNTLLNEYKQGGQFVNAQGEFNPGFSFTTNEVLDFRRKPVTRIMVERAFYDETLKYDPSEFPGQTSADTNNLTADIYLKRNTQYQKWYAGNMQSTGLYAPAHTAVTVTLPDHVDPSKMQLVIGVGDNVTGLFRHEINLKRPPKYVKKYKFIASSGNSTNTITVEHAYGGLIFLKSFDSSVDNDAVATVSFTGVQKAIKFVLGVTTESDWNALRTSIAPKAELESKHYIVTVPRGNMASLSFEEVTQVAEGFDEVSQNAYDFYGYDRSCAEPLTVHSPPTCELKKAHKHREVFDPHISIGAGHSGYPIMVMNWNPEKTTFPQDPRSSFLLWHEMGHNMVESWLGIAGAGEVANNVMALHQQQRFGKSLSTSGSIGRVSSILAKGQPWADGGNAGRLLMFYQMTQWIDQHYVATMKTNNAKYYNADGTAKSEYPFLDGNGFDLFKILHREARDRNEEADKYDICRKQSGRSNTDMLALCTSAILEIDTHSFFAAWNAGVVGIGNIDGQNIYDASGGLNSDLATNYTTRPNPSIQSISGE